MSNSLWTHGMQHTRLPCPSLSPRVHSNSCSLNQWCHPTISSIHDTGKPYLWLYGPLSAKVMSLLYNTLSRFVIVFHQRSKYLLISWLISHSAVILEPKKIKSVTASTFPPSICCELMEPDSMILVLWFLFCLFVCFFKLLRFKPAFSLFYPHQEAL